MSPSLMPIFLSLVLLMLVVGPSAAQNTVCGDGRHFFVEECDDGNLQNGDGCSSQCRVETGWRCTTTSVLLSQCSQPSPQPTTEESGSKNWLPWIIVGICLFIASLIFVGVAILLANKNNREDPPSDDDNEENTGDTPPAFAPIEEPEPDLYPAASLDKDPSVVPVPQSTPENDADAATTTADTMRSMTFEVPVANYAYDSSPVMGAEV
eukprot:NODE_1525_length_866_cov_212.403917_g1184_i0.p1 GENE.NODE_1525_length_866_cov_212.403917_g1184_i0~~NODE_1525_length_866_cov_212.403917_g1184_i0.p1  ORF type:complete len:209 (-),score=26.68 NODE_1525_length_866_cov_212.403917_g1184_i0:154-780(-)